jgi:hypothetical protein
VVISLGVSTNAAGMGSDSEATLDMMVCYSFESLRWDGAGPRFTKRGVCHLKSLRLRWFMGRGTSPARATSHQANHLGPPSGVGAARWRGRVAQGRAGFHHSHEYQSAEKPEIRREGGADL